MTGVDRGLVTDRGPDVGRREPSCVRVGTGGSRVAYGNLNVLASSREESIAHGRLQNHQPRTTRGPDGCIYCAISYLPAWRGVSRGTRPMISCPTA